MKKTPDGKDTNVPSKTPDEINKSIEILRFYAQGATDAYVTHLTFGGKADQEQEDYINALDDGANALAYIEQLEARIPKWVRYKEKSPQEAGNYLVRCIHWYSDNDGYECYKIAVFDPKILWVNLGNLLKVTHWMPLPEMPKEE